MVQEIISEAAKMHPNIHIRIPDTETSHYVVGDVRLNLTQSSVELQKLLSEIGFTITQKETNFYGQFLPRKDSVHHALRMEFH